MFWVIESSIKEWVQDLYSVSTDKDN